MTTIPLPTEFSELLKLLSSHEVKYLIVGGYAVAYHGLPRTTGDIDIWIERSPENAARVAKCLRDFGFNVPELSANVPSVPIAILKLEQIRPLPGNRIYPRYADGAEGDVDLSEVVGRDVFSRLSDPEHFGTVYITESGDMPCGQDLELCADTLYVKLTG